MGLNPAGRSADAKLQAEIGAREAGRVKMHANQLAISPETARRLVHEQFPAWRDLSIRAVDSPGTVNAIFRIGTQLAARFPLEPDDVGPVRKRLESEAGAARELAGRTRFATPGRSR